MASPCCSACATAGQRHPVIFLTARDATDDRVRGLTIGGDDYLVKPFAVEELVARVRLRLRRAGRRRHAQRCAAPTSSSTTTPTG